MENISIFHNGIRCFELIYPIGISQITRLGNMFPTHGILKNHKIPLISQVALLQKAVRLKFV